MPLRAGYKPAGPLPGVAIVPVKVRQIVEGELLRWLALDQQFGW